MNRSKLHLSWGTAIVLCAAAGCADELKSVSASDGGTGRPDAAAQSPSKLQHEEQDEIVHTTVDATSETEWVYMDVQSQQQVMPSEPASSEQWDLAFQRFKVKLNGGASGPGGAAAAKVSDTEFGDLTQAPAEGYETDSEGDGGDRSAPGLVLSNEESGWYAYNPETHMLSPREVVFVLKTVEEDYFKVQFTGYYDQAGTAGHVQFRWAPVEPPQNNGGE